MPEEEDAFIRSGRVVAFMDRLRPDTIYLAPAARAEFQTPEQVANTLSHESLHAAMYRIGLGHNVSAAFDNRTSRRHGAMGRRGMRGEP